MQATTEDLMAAIYDEKDRKANFSPSRQRLTLPPRPGSKSGQALGKYQALSDAGIMDGSVVHLKDLGVQVWLVCVSPSQQLSVFFGLTA
jgi:hypothetical protein